MTNERTPLAQYIQDERKKRGWSQERLGKEANLSSGTISLVERDIGRPETATIEKLADAFGVDRGYMLDLLMKSHADGLTQPELDPAALRLAYQISDLPPGVRRTLLGSMQGILATVGELAGASSRAWQLPVASGGITKGGNVGVREWFESVDLRELLIDMEVWKQEQERRDEAFDENDEEGYGEEWEGEAERLYPTTEQDRESTARMAAVLRLSPPERSVVMLGLFIEKLERMPRFFHKQLIYLPLHSLVTTFRNADATTKRGMIDDLRAIGLSRFPDQLAEWAKGNLRASSGKIEAEMNRRMQRGQVDESANDDIGSDETEAARN